jgi:hypothetical protein
MGNPMANKPHGFSIAIALPHPFAKEDEDEGEHDIGEHQDRDGGESDSPGQHVIQSIADMLQHGGKAEIEAVRGLAQCLERIAESAADDDASGVNKWCERAAGLLDLMLEGHKGK